MKKKTKKKGQPLVYIPEGARINTENIEQKPPSTKYEHWNFDDDVKRALSGGLYGIRKRRK